MDVEWRSLSAVLPYTHLPRPERPWVDMAMRSICCPREKSMIAVTGSSPLITFVFALPGENRSATLASLKGLLQRLFI